jgi:hypothetical protein
VTALGRFIRDSIDKLQRRYYEGPEPPPRLEQEVRIFAATHRDATVEDWKAFATKLAENAYRDGFTRGDQWAHRLWPGPEHEPEMLAEAAAHNASLPEERIRRLEQQPSPIEGIGAREAARLQHQLHRAGARLITTETQDRSTTGSPYPRRRV